jgi:uncharacterized protein (DUF2267 family)
MMDAASSAARQQAAGGRRQAWRVARGAWRVARGRLPVAGGSTFPARLPRNQQAALSEWVRERGVGTRFGTPEVVDSSAICRRLIPTSC